MASSSNLLRTRLIFKHIEAFTSACISRVPNIGSCSCLLASLKCFPINHEAVLQWSIHELRLHRLQRTSDVRPWCGICCVQSTKKVLVSLKIKIFRMSDFRVLQLSQQGNAVEDQLEQHVRVTRMKLCDQAAAFNSNRGETYNAEHYNCESVRDPIYMLRQVEDPS